MVWQPLACISAWLKVRRMQPPFCQRPYLSLSSPSCPLCSLTYLPDFINILKNLFVFIWRIIALQCCVGFCHISTWISHRYAYACPLLLGPASHLPLLEVVTENRFELSADFINIWVCHLFPALWRTQAFEGLSFPTCQTICKFVC